MFEGGWALIAFILFGLFVWMSKKFDWFADPDVNKKINSDGILIAIKDFESHGRFIRKGTKGGIIHPSANIDLTDNSWVEAGCQIRKGADIYESYVRDSIVENWHVVRSEVLNCDLQAYYPIHWTVDETLRDKEWDKSQGKMLDKEISKPQR